MPEEKKKQRKSSALALLTPDSVDVTINGSSVRVATSRQENSVMNMVVQAQLRTLLQEQIKQYKEDENKLTPKELRDLAEAAKSLALASDEIYKISEPLKDGSSSGQEQKVDAIDFGTMATLDGIEPEGDK